MLALVFNVTNVVGFTYACVFCISYDSSSISLLSHSSDRDAKKRWANNVVSSNWSMGGLGGQMLTGVVKNSVGRVFGS
jgi:hypothetical protein